MRYSGTTKKSFETSVIDHNALSA
uniref:Uncharacterized protein n=1 Tax=Anguilla anguilla TaxID=7936 RepID=A0A0E9SCC1_ANGAN